MYELKGLSQIDKAANVIIQLATTRPDFIKFTENDAVCPRCGTRLGVYYCENGTFAVRCLSCETITLVKHRNPGGAVQKVAAKANEKRRFINGK